WGADLLARKDRFGHLADWRHMLVPLMPGAGVLCLLVMEGDDLGTTFILLVIFLALLWVIGTPGRVYSGVLILMALAMVLMIVSAKYRFQRLTGYLQPQGSATGPNMQSIQGKYAVGSGGWFGVGLGASGGKWGWVPESTTDFIFAIIGEELGLVGTLCVTVLYGGLAFAGLRIARRVPDVFCRLGAAAITAWIVMQATVNIGAVIGVLPITGVPLPLVSAGLSSLLVTLIALGMLMSFARLGPGARHALAARGPARLAGAVNAAAAALDRARAQVVVGFGGYVATPAYLAARRRRVPIVVHEANPKPGLANRLGARFTTHVFTGHQDTVLRNGKYIGIPIRREIADLDRLGVGDKARMHFGLRPDLPVLLVTGGSQGARSLND